MLNVVIRLQTLDGTWEVGGVDRRRGIMPENVKYGADNWGSSAASFDLRREVDAIWPDLRAYTPIEIEVNGLLVWSGRIKETPTRDSATESVINVQAEGWQFHLDDDAYKRLYVASNLSDWKDTRTFSGFEDLNSFPIGDLTVINDRGTITLGNPKGGVWDAGKAVGVTFDCGPGQEAREVTFLVAKGTSAGYGNAKIYVRHTNYMFATGTFTIGAQLTWLDSITNVDGVTAISTGGSLLTGTVAAGTRYITFFLYNAGASYTAGNDDVWSIWGAWIATDAAYLGGAGNTVLLTTDMVVRDAVAKATRNLSSDQSLIATTTFAPPEFNMSQFQTPREVISAVNAFHDYDTRVDVNKRLVFAPRSTSPALVAGRWSNAEVEDAAANSGAEIYNRCVITGQNVGSEDVIVDRYSGEATDVALFAPSDITVSNPSADVNASNWGSSAGAVTRDTTVFQSNGASIKWDGTGVADLNWIETGFTGGTFRKGITYKMALSMRSASVSSMLRFHFGVINIDTNLIQSFTPWILGQYGLGASSNTWVRTGTNVIYWTPRADYAASAVRLRMQFWRQGVDFVAWNFDDLALYQSRATLVDRQATTRAKVFPVGFALDNNTGRTLADVFLSQRRATPFKGSIKAFGDRAFRDPTTAEPVPAYALPLYAGQLLRLDHVIDPDTGGLGRDARMAEVQVDLNDSSASISLDNSRANFEALLERLAVVLGAITR